MITRTIGVFAILVAAAATLAALPPATDIDKFGWVTNNVALGGQPTIAQIATLSREGFHTIVNLREPSEYDAAAEEAAAKENKLTYINIPVKPTDPKAEQVDLFLKTLANSRIYPAFIHCGTANRVAAFWMIRRVVLEGWEVQDAEREAKILGLKTETMRNFALEYIQNHPVAR